MHKNNGLNCRYTTFITLLYFLFSEYIDEINESNYDDLKTLNKMILTLVDDANDKNYIKIIDFIQKKKYDINNELLNKLMVDKDIIKHTQLLNEFNNSTKIDYNSEGYICQLFKIFNNKKEYCLIEKKQDICILYNKKYEKIVKPYHHMVEINEDYFNMKNLLNIFIESILNYDCVCKKIKDNFVTTKTKYSIISFTDFLFIFFEFDYNNMVKYKDNIIKLSEKYFLLGLDISYKLIGLVIVPFVNHYACIIINSSGKFIKNK